MRSHITVVERIIHTVRANPECRWEALTQRLQDHSWSEVFLEVDRVSRSGQLRLTRGGGRFTTTLRAL
jgi:hypothetical protein